MQSPGGQRWRGSVWPGIAKGLGDRVDLSVSYTGERGFGQAGIVIPGLGNHDLKQRGRDRDVV